MILLIVAAIVLVVLAYVLRPSSLTEFTYSSNVSNARSTAKQPMAKPMAATKTAKSTKVQPGTVCNTELLFLSGTSSETTVDILRKNVVGIEVSRAWFPRGEHLVDLYNDTLQLCFEDGDVKASIPVGSHYTICSVLVAIQDSVRAKGHPTFTSTFDETRSIAEFTNDRVFSIKPTPLSRMLGFQDPGPMALTTTAAGRCDLAGARYIDLTTNLGEHSSNVLAQVAMSPAEPIVLYEPRVYVRTFAPRMVKRLDLHFSVDENGSRRPYQFNGLQWHVTLLVKTLAVDAPSTVPDLGA